MENKKFKKLPISVVMVIYNEEAVLERALLSCFDIVDEIIIIHDGKCNDRSLEIAKKYTDKIFEFDRQGVAEPHRVKTYEMAINDWILQLDADEYLSRELRNNMEELISSGVDIFDVSWSTHHKNTHHFWYYKRTLFRKSKVYFIGTCQEYVRATNKNVSVEKTNYALFHEPMYDNSTFATFRKKWKPWTKIQAKHLATDFSNLPKWNCNLQNWEKHQKMRIDHPIVFGMLAMPLYHSFFSLKNFARHRKFVLLKLGALYFMYHFYLYYNLVILKNKKKV